LVVDRDVLAGLAHDQAAWASVGRPAVAFRAANEAEVQTAVRIAASIGSPVVPRGAGTGLSGGANAVDDCLLLDLSRMRGIVEIDPANLVCVVEPGW
jgi:glycolate oxidase